MHAVEIPHQDVTTLVTPSGHFTIVAVQPYGVSIGFACSRRPLLDLPRDLHPASTAITKSTRNGPYPSTGLGLWLVLLRAARPLTVPSFVNPLSRNDYHPTGPAPAASFRSSHTACLQSYTLASMWVQERAKIALFVIQVGLSMRSKA
jgi:hypothetical protein